MYSRDCDSEITVIFQVKSISKKPDILHSSYCILFAPRTEYWCYV